MSRTAELLAFLDECILKAERYESKLAADGSPLMEVGGFCGLKGRHLWNNLGSLPGIRYLEVGVLHGATLLSAAYGNDGEYVGIDSFCQDGLGADPAACRANLAKWGGSRVSLIEEDCWVAVPAGGFDVFYYDGGHTREETARSFVHFRPVMQREFIMLVDDATWPDVYRGIEDGLGALSLRGVRCEAWRALGIGRENDGDGYWNGCWAGVFIQK